MQKQILDKLLDFLFDKIWKWGKPFMVIAFPTLTTSLLALAKHPILKEPAVVLLVAAVSLASIFSIVEFVQKFLDKRNNAKKAGAGELSFVETQFEIELNPKGHRISDAKNLGGFKPFKQYSKVENSNDLFFIARIQFIKPILIDNYAFDIMKIKGVIEYPYIAEIYFDRNENGACLDIVMEIGNIDPNGRYKIQLLSK